MFGAFRLLAQKFCATEKRAVDEFLVEMKKTKIRGVEVKRNDCAAMN
jgi:hypothetical protein